MIEDFLEMPGGISDYQLQRDNIINNLLFLKNMDVTEHVFYKKYQEVQEYLNFANQSDVTKAKIWKPKNIFDKQSTIKEIEDIDPEVIFVNPKNESLSNDWLMIRVFVHTMPFDQTPGRFLKFLIRDKSSNKYLGALSVSSDVISINVRDKYIGWDNKLKLENGKLNNSAIGSCIMSTQPFGYNFLGSKLSAMMVVSSVVRNKWEELYETPLVGMTTTSLYGTKSFYNGVPCWRKCGSSSGKISIKPDEKYYSWWHNYIKNNYPDQYKKKMTQKEGVSGPVTGAKQRVIDMIFSHLKLKSSNFVHGYNRGVYYSCFYDKTLDFLTGKCTFEDLSLKEKFKDNHMISWWKEKSIKRYEKLHKSNMLLPEVTYYNVMINDNYENCKEKFFGNVGR